MRRRQVLVAVMLLALAGCDAGSGYARKDGGWVYGGKHPFVPADPGSFKALDERFARDALRGYYRGEQIADSDGRSFAVLSEHEARDAHRVFYADTYRKGQEYWTVRYNRIEVIAGADPASYRPLAHGYARDLAQVYFEGRAFKVRDVASFEALDSRYARDAQRGYFERIEIAGSHGPSFALLDVRDANFARDRAQVYHGSIDHSTPNVSRVVVRVLRGADPASARLVGRGYVADARQVWYRAEPVAGADPASFAYNEDFASEIDAHDQRHRYRQGQRVVEGQAAPVPR